MKPMARQFGGVWLLLYCTVDLTADRRRHAGRGAAKLQDAHIIATESEMVKGKIRRGIGGRSVTANRNFGAFELLCILDRDLDHELKGQFVRDAADDHHIGA